YLLKFFAGNDSITKWDLKRGNTVIPATRTFRELRRKGEIADNEQLQMIRNPPKTDIVEDPMDYDLAEKKLEDSIHAPNRADTAKMDEVEPNPQKELVREATLNAFLGKDAPSYAKVLAQRTKSAQIVSSSYLSERRCAISPDIKAKRPVPNTDMTNVAFWDLSTIEATQAEIWEAICDINPVGYSMRDNAQWLELAFATVEQRNEHLTKTFEVSKGQFICPLPPRKWSPQQVYIRLANVPLMPEKQLRETIKDYWSHFGKVGRIEPHYYRDSKILSR